MRYKLILRILFIWLFVSSIIWAETTFCPPPIPRGEGYRDICGNVFQVKSDKGLLSGFISSVDGEIGIITALHGVLGGRNIIAYNEDYAFSELHMLKVDICRDVAFLTSNELKNSQMPYLASKPLADFDFLKIDMYVIGYPQGIPGQLSHEVNPHTNAVAQLKYVLPGPTAIEMGRRGSPHIETKMLNLKGSVQNGYSGAPVLAGNGYVVAVVDGGLGGGSLDIGWAIPFSDIEWMDTELQRAELNRIHKLSHSENFFGVNPDQNPILPVLYLADGGDSVGKIYKLSNGRFTEYYQRPKGRIYSLAVSPKGIFFSDHNDNYLYVLRKGKEVLLYTHTTYLRDLEFDPKGNLFFSESSGAREDGKIYQVKGNRASLYFRVRLKDVDGFWAGDFAFDNYGDLWLSSGNMVPSNLYRVENSQPRRVFTSSGCITGFCFLKDGSLLFTDHKKSLHQIRLPDYITSKVKTYNNFKWLSDVEAINWDYKKTKK